MVFSVPFTQLAFCLPYISGSALGTVHLVHQATFVHLFSFVLGGHKSTADGIGRFSVDLDPQFSDGSVEGLRI